MPLAHAETLIFYGRFLRHSGDLPKARKVLRRALQILEPIGAGRLLSIAAEELAVAGGQPRRSYGRSQELTAQERRVATIAANGLTNKEIAERLYVSVKTVDHHLSSIYRKLGVNSRRGLMLLLRN
jgi:DNA-binding CsgD family transcriptional regulator